MVSKNIFLVFFKDSNKNFAKYIFNRIRENNELKNSSRVILTGGNTVKKVYQHINEKELIKMSNLNFFLSDERNVSKFSNDSNYKNILENLFKKNDNFKLNSVNTDNRNKTKEAIRYSNLLDDCIDIIILSLGSDTHVASLFPNYNALNNNILNFTYEKSRFTITPKIIKKAKEIIVLVSGKDKGLALRKCLENKKNYNLYPGTILLDKACWLLDQDAFLQLPDSLKKDNLFLPY